VRHGPFAGADPFLTEDPSSSSSSLRRDCLDTAHPERNPKLRDDISTDEITPATSASSSTKLWVNSLHRLEVRQRDAHQARDVSAAGSCARSAASAAAKAPAASSRRTPDVGGIKLVMRKTSSASTSRIVRTSAC